LYKLMQSATNALKISVLANLHSLIQVRFLAPTYLYLGVQNNQLRYFTAQGELVPTPKELAAQEKQRADEEKQRAECQAAKLRELNIDPDML
ncbi:MAG: hypothetical protein ACRAVC_14870, partial [Trichormus sp.]